MSGQLRAFKRTEILQIRPECRLEPIGAHFESGHTWRACNQERATTDGVITEAMTILEHAATERAIGVADALILR